jgi:ribosomal protein S18 acetylase RimI-like enzyme
MKISIEVVDDISKMLYQYDLIKLLNPNLTKETYQNLLIEMVKNNYKQAICFYQNKPIGVSGFWINSKIYSGKYLEIDNFVVDEAFRGKEIGRQLCNFLIDLAKNENCEVVMLDAYLENINAHRFYEKTGFQKKGFHFIKKLI